MRCSIRSLAEIAALLPWLLLVLPGAARAENAGAETSLSRTHVEPAADGGPGGGADVQPAKAEVGAGDSAEAPVPVKPPSAAELQARSEFAVAQREYDLGRFELAVMHYSKAYEALPLPELLFNIGQCHRQLRHFDKAAFFYRRYLDLAGTPENAKLTRELLSEVEERQKDTESFERELARNAVHAITPAAPAPVESEVPLYRRWWVWAAVGGVVAAGATAVALAASQPPAPSLGTVNGR